jgi:hypothetical protein
MDHMAIVLKLLLMSSVGRSLQMAWEMSSRV